MIEIKDFRGGASDVWKSHVLEGGILAFVEFLFAVGGLLLTPGPTNTLLALAGASVGLRRALPLIGAEIAGYLSVVLPLVLVEQSLMGRWPTAGDAVALAAAVWVMYLAIRLWKAAVGTPDRTDVTAGGVFVTTLLNPKGLIFGLVLLPGIASPDFLPKIGAFVLLTVLVATLWACFGASLGRGGAGASSLLLRRVAACWLGLLSAGLFASVVMA